MFHRDDELKKGGGAQRSKTDVLEEARRKRSERERQRHAERHVVVIQSLVRRYMARTALIRRLLDDVDRKLRDIATLQQMLQKAFVLPSPAIMPLVDAMLFAVKLRPSSTKKESSRLVEEDVVRVMTLVGHLHSNWTLSDENYTASFGTMSTRTLKKILSVCLEAGQVPRHASGLLFVEALAGSTKTCPPATQNRAIMQVLIHDTLTPIQSPWWKAASRTSYIGYMREALIHSAKMSTDASASWYRLFFHLIQHALSATEKTTLVVALTSHILTIPTLEPPALWRQHLHALWPSIWQIPFEASLCPVSTLTGIPCSVFLLGNALALRPSSSRHGAAHDGLHAELRWLTQLLVAIPDESFSAEPLSWLHVSKSHSIPVVFPPAVVAQLRLLYQYPLMAEWCSACFSVNVDGLLNPLTNSVPVPMFPNAGTDEEKYGFGYIPQQGSFSILKRLLKIKKPQWATKLLQFNPFKSSTSTASASSSSRRPLAAAPPPPITAVPFDHRAFLALVPLYGVFLFRWKSTAKQNTVEMLSLLTFYRDNTPRRHSLVTTLWLYFQETQDIDRYAETTWLARCMPTDPLASLLLVFALTYNNLLVVLNDTEMYDLAFPLPLIEVERVVVFFKQLLYRHYWLASNASDATTPFGAYVVDVATRLLQTLYNRCSRRPFCNVTSWIVKELDGDDMLESVLNQDPRGVTLLQHMPYLLPYADRVRLFESLLTLEREQNQVQGTASRIVIRRGYVLEDGLTKLNAIRRDLKKKIQVHFINEAGLEETGIDAGGLFKEFWTELSQLAFDPNYGLFQCSEDQLMFPNPNSAAIHSNDTLLFEFLGRILGKALYENIVVQPKFARFFLTKLLGNHNQINDLPSLDVELFKNLMFLRAYDGDVSELGLTFSIGQDCFGVHKEIELLPGGGAVAVTSENRFRYIHLAANYYLNVQIRAQSAAFLAGLRDVIDLRLLHMFNEPELQVLISGAAGAFDLDDLKSAAIYAGGYFSQDRRIGWLWKALESFSPSERALFLRFVTSCQRAPILGFHSLHPPFCVQKISIRTDDEKLPSASTCFNTLKLPTYSSYKVLRDKLLTAITSGAGFEMT
ncbi:Aste57867_9094 [Aphanomyces stellatus]|uniref:HECT-type E3 ubiquitin transferase n=1 Tax=Aphanomyces stellatus TaxID=120398 RepID=A0A485KMC2_9STRA|nr:hypothetical protein As57867_009058 [Aphanomyces stellatus]VFT85978.1 Aste57867_9094 [Aphanomyces stellatus]